MTEFSTSLRRAIKRPRLLTSTLVALLLFGFLQLWLPPLRALLIAFDVGAGLFLVLMLRVMGRATPADMHRRATIQDDGKWAVLCVSLGVALVVLAALSGELHAARSKSLWDIALVASSIFMAWLFVAVVFAQHYAHSFYLLSGQLSFPGTENPDYWDFTYFSLVISMCCQTSDVTVNSGGMRRLVILHSVVAFFFNVIIIAISVNVAAGML